ncbi:Hydroxyacylglutathione hydrolase [uncultured archaeon]|nr:Hydroxyacylglutathione hydrolase [uncultured archaeon]
MAKILQLRVGGFDDNFSYLVLGEGKHSKEAVLIDPTGNKELIDAAIKKHDLRIVLQTITHNHPDHRELFDYFSSKGVPSIIPASKQLGEFEEKIVAGFSIRFIHTPGHTSDCVCIQLENNLFTGDTLFARGVGNTQYGGNESEQEETIAFLSQLDQKLIIWPGHDYGGAKCTLHEALKNAHLKPSKRVLDLIANKVKEYNLKVKK